MSTPPSSIAAVMVAAVMVVAATAAGIASNFVGKLCFLLLSQTEVIDL
jgi:hypothetical protein